MKIARTSVRPRVAFQGELGAFSHEAVRKLLGDRASVLPCPSFSEVFAALKKGRATHAVIPIENTLHGSILENYDHLLRHKFYITGETSVRISHQLIALPGVHFRSVKRVFSHPVALNQCRTFFETHPHLEAVPYYDTAGSVKMLKQEGLRDAAAIASQGAAEIYQCVILRRNIEDDRQNFTRFFLLSKQALKPTRSGPGWKTSIVFSTPNVPGALFRAMACFALRDLNLSKIESRPLRGRPWEYLFYVDLLGSTHDKTVQSALANLNELAPMVRVLGSYQSK
ncbi:MAG TPA: prephenate dehydratase [Chthonomonas sp.]|uniref:prephenate dehydratase n=1 Tax=Chthonomonas sp. TaxID=2282153 RepID=UPI002B4AFA53|nr:prephenate dehydratase [Chthonomonas sp.]HLI50052.1 prephenate dehydratase [Chthonomonas sp.]